MSNALAGVRLRCRGGGADSPTSGRRVGGGRDSWDQDWGSRACHLLRTMRRGGGHSDGGGWTSGSGGGGLVGGDWCWLGGSDGGQVRELAGGRA
jgi:hypothetical protein